MILIICALLCLTPWVSAPMALVLGIALALSLGNPYIEKTKAFTPRLLALSVVGLGAGMDLSVIARVGLRGIGYTVTGIAFTLIAGVILGKLLKTTRNIALLITVGTAICGGSAIAAVAPTVNAKDHEVSVALGTVFLLNALALLIFPPIGHHFQLSEIQFGLWSALAIHDTSSVVGAASQYGSYALEIATIVKLARALWIVPIALCTGWLFKDKQGESQTGKTKRPWFILGFLAAAAIVTWFPALRPVGHGIELVARRSLVLTLFFIGSNLSWNTLKSVGVRSIAHGLILWVIVGTTTLVALHLQFLSPY